MNKKKFIVRIELCPDNIRPEDIRWVLYDKMGLDTWVVEEVWE